MKDDPLTDILTLASARCVEVGTPVAGGSWALRFPPHPRKADLRLSSFFIQRKQRNGAAMQAEAMWGREAASTVRALIRRA